ncbi:FxLYD domain-containing protein [Bacillus marinisedimentorum]|uniref:FxLYD domain-containing protein n=1 Tax=Bacillus marinisedimentorum TaxID=1821260 RepID=UPI0007DE6CAA|nr:FxLYD domain-containing protein [Bacillus marinisedimentorum]
MWKDKRIIISLLIVLSMIGSVVIYLNFFSLDESSVENLNEQLVNNEEIAKYVLFINVSRDNIEEPVKYNGKTSYTYNVIGNATEKFLELGDTEKLNVLYSIAEVVDENIENVLLDCGRNKYCSIDSISVIDMKEKSSIFSIDYDTSNPLEDTVMTHTYYDENDDFQSRTVSNTNTNGNNGSGNSTNGVVAGESTETLKLEETSCKVDGDYVYVEGYVKNPTGIKYSYIKVQATYTDASGNIIDTDWTYAVGSEGLSPNSRKSFDIMTPYNESISNCSYKIIDFK